MKNYLAPLLLGIATASLVSVPRIHADDRPDVGRPGAAQTSHTVQRDVRVQLHYLLYLPKDFQNRDAWPLVLFLHGAGERGDNLDQVKKHGPPKLVEQGKEFPFVLVSPQCPANKWWDPVSLSALLDEAVEKHKIDKDRIYVTGLSMGGFGTWALAAHSPKRFAAIVPICGGGEPVAAKILPGVPAWVFHGGKDPVVPLARSQTMVDALKQAGGEVKFTVYPDAGHDSWTETYANPKVYEWMLSHKRKNDPERRQ